MLQAIKNNAKKFLELKNIVLTSKSEDDEYKPKNESFKKVSSIFSNLVIQIFSLS